MSEELDLAGDFRTIETFFENAANAELKDETWSLEPLRAEQALARLRTQLAITDKALRGVEFLILGDGPDPRCPACGRTAEEKHLADCEIGQALSPNTTEAK